MDIKFATLRDCDNIRELMDLSISELQKPYLSSEQIKASYLAMGLDTQLIEDKTYFCVWDGKKLTGCGGWSRRATLYGGNHSQGRNAALLDPEKDRARIRAMYTHPNYVKRGIGRLIIEASERAARDYGFAELEMAATLAGRDFYLKCGYHIENEFEDRSGDVAVPLLTMVKRL